MSAASNSSNTKFYWRLIAFAGILVSAIFVYKNLLLSEKKQSQPTGKIEAPQAVNNSNITAVNNVVVPQASSTKIQSTTHNNSNRKHIKKYFVPSVVGERNLPVPFKTLSTDDVEKSNTTTANTTNWALLDTFYQAIAKKPVIYQVDPQKDTTFQLPEGTIVTIPANTLAYANGHPVTRAVTLSATEFYDRASMIYNGLSTVANNQPLVTGGMLKLTAKDDTGLEVHIKSNSAIDIQMPYKVKDENMQLFLPATKPISTNTKSKKDSSNIQMLNSLDWMASGQWQARMPVPMAYVINWTQEPTITLGSTYKAVYLIDQTCELTNEQIKEELKRRFPEYNKIKVRRAWDHPIRIFSNFSKKEKAATFGEKEEMELGKAKKLKLVTPKEEAGFLKSFQEELKRYKDDSVRLAAMAQLQNKYGFKVRALGLINCDRFMNDSRPKVLYTINSTDTAEKYFVHRLFFHSINSIMVPYSEAAIAFRNIPVGEKVTLVSVGVKGNQTVSSIKTFTADNGASALTLDYKSTEPAAFKSELQSILDTFK